MGFFDLNIPYTESNKRVSTSEKTTRLKLAVKAMELGYSGVAYNRTITGVMSEVDRCSISLFPLSSVLKVSPSVSTSVNFHRRLVNVPTSTPFRQYTRLTVVVDAPAQGSALNSGNPVLKTYDIIAVRPMKQESFDQACKNYEVDIIAIDFSENRFRLRQPFIKAAIERGVYFEITYSSLILDAQSRRQTIANAKLLVDWTRGKNLIFSSAAPSVTELRGPYDVANLASLLGFSMERAKAAVSKTCRSLLANALRKKKFYKGAIRVELMSSSKQFDVEGTDFDDWLNWDPISSGEGDLELDDMAKSFAASSKESKTVKAIDFVSITDGLPSYQLQIKDMVSETKGISEPDASSKNLSAPPMAVKSTAVYDVPMDSKLHDAPETLVTETLEKDPLLSFGNCSILSANETLEASASAHEDETRAMVIKEEANISSDSKACVSCPGAKQHNLQDEAISETNVTNDEKASLHALAKDAGMTYASSALPIAGVSNVFNGNHPTLWSEEANKFSFSAPTCSSTIALNKVGIKQSKGDSVVSFSDASLHEEFVEGERTRETGDFAVSPVSSSMALSGESLNDDVPEEHVNGTGEDDLVAPSCTLQINGGNSVVHEPSADVPMEDQIEFKDRRKQRCSHGSISFPFKRLLKPSHFKRIRKLKTKSRIA